MRYVICIFVGCLFAMSLPLLGSAKPKATAKTTPTNEDKKDYPNFEWEIYGGLRFNYSKNRMCCDPPPRFAEERIGGSFLLGFIADLDINKYFRFYTNLDMGVLTWEQTTTPQQSSGKTIYNSKFSTYLNNYNLLITEQDIAQAQANINQCKEQARKQGLNEADCEDPHFLLQESLFIRELMFSFYFNSEKWIKLDVGFFNKVLGRAFIMDNYVMGLHFDLNWSKRPTAQKLPIRLEFDIFLPDTSFTVEGKMSPVLNLKFSYVSGDNLKLGLFATYLYDGNNMAGKLLLPLWKELFASQLNSFISSKTGDTANFYCDQVYMPRQHSSLSDPSKMTPAQRKQYIESLQKDIDNQGFEQEDIDKLAAAFPRATQDLASSVALAGFIDACSALPSSVGHHAWFGLEAVWKWNKKLSIEGTAIFYVSDMTIGLPTGANRYKAILNPATNPRRLGQSSVNTSPLYGTHTQSLSLHEALNTQQNQGEGDISTIVKDTRIQGISFLGELKLAYHWIPSLSTGIFLIYAMGDSLHRQKSTINSFMGIAPQVRYTNVFFNGGINAYSSQRGIGISGISGRGYTSPGVILTYQSQYKDESERAKIKLTSALYWASDLPPYKDPSGKSGQFYGGEINVIGSYNFRMAEAADKWMALKPVVQIDFFFPGNFFAAGSPPPLMFQLMLGLDFSW